MPRVASGIEMGMGTVPMRESVSYAILRVHFYVVIFDGRCMKLKLKSIPVLHTIIADIDEYVLSCCLAVTAKELLSRRGGSPTVPP